MHQAGRTEFLRTTRHSHCASGASLYKEEKLRRLTEAGALLLEGRTKQVTICNEMERSKFEALVAQALSRLPRTFREKLTNVVIIVEDLPPKEAESEGLLLGLFHGIPRTQKSVFLSTPPDRIVLYQRNIEAMCASE